MRRNLFYLSCACLVVAAGFFSACSSEDSIYDEAQSADEAIVTRADAGYEIRVLTFEDTIDDYWASLIDDPQYGGPLLYPSDYSTLYSWCDEDNTKLAHELPNPYNDCQYWGGGHAISNYVEYDLDNGDYLHQLAIYSSDKDVVKVGHEGSDNFCVHYGYKDSTSYTNWITLPSIYFSDNKERVIDHMYVAPTAYLLNCAQQGNDYTAKLSKTDWIVLVATGYDLNGISVGTSEFYLAQGTSVIGDWTKWDLSELGKVYKVEFNVTGSSDNGYGFSMPAYFAYDDVAVRFETTD